MARGIHYQIKNPTLTTADFSFFESPKGFMVDTVIDADGGLGVAMAGQLDLKADAPTAGSVQGVRGSVRVANVTETYGVLGYVDVQAFPAVAIGVAGIIRGTLADQGPAAPLYGIASVSEGNFPAAAGLAVYASGENNKYHYGVLVASSIAAAFKGEVNAGGVGLSLSNITTIGSAETQTVMFLNRVYSEVGDALDIKFGGGDVRHSAPGAGTIRMLAAGVGLHSLEFHVADAGVESRVMAIYGDGNLYLQPKPVYADHKAAIDGNLKSGMIYRNPDGFLMQVP